jgi:hypothetical protein
MSKQLCSLKRAKQTSLALFFIGLAVVSMLGAWWPGIMLAVGIPLAIRQVLLGRRDDMIISLVVFGGVFFAAEYNLGWRILLPVLFAVGGIYIFFREVFEGKEKEAYERKRR